MELVSPPRLLVPLSVRLAPHVAGGGKIGQSFSGCLVDLYEQAVLFLHPGLSLFRPSSFLRGLFLLRLVGRFLVPSDSRGIPCDVSYEFVGKMFLHEGVVGLPAEVARG